ncbi:deoxyguanosinetriphosphate triphosphohydrolase [Oceanidesulfovibrio marinus]|nr:deoxyguanosinetriphosphate triphosphohydrolase [Oceanidesulfovibrio marinus]
MSKVMKWDELIKPHRVQRGNKGIQIDLLDGGRSPFQKDQDKILFSNSFRRLGKKTQVHPLVNNDHIHTRLSHSLETASVGRSLAVKMAKKVEDVFLNNDINAKHVGEIVQAACLAHDIGNPPFGHAGEDAIKDWFKDNDNHHLISKLDAKQQADFKYYDGNAMGFRVLTKTEYDSFEGGMRLSFPTLAAMMKYPWSALKSEDFGKEKFSSFSSEVEMLNEVATHLGMIRKGDDWWCRHPLAYLVEAADDICYSLLDLEDAKELRIVNLKYLKRELFDKYHDGDDEYSHIVGKRDVSDRRKLAFIRGITVDKLIEDVSNAFSNKHEEIMKGCLEGSIIEHCTEDSRELLKTAGEICERRVYQHHRKIELEIGSYNALGAMLSAFGLAAKELSEVKEYDELGFKSKRVVDLLGVNRPKPGTGFHEIMMRFLDYLGGMTDNFATHISCQILGHGASSTTR